MRSSDTPENDRWRDDPELAAPQGPADWKREVPSDSGLSLNARERLGLHILNTPRQDDGQC